MEETTVEVDCPKKEGGNAREMLIARFTLLPSLKSVLEETILENSTNMTSDGPSIQLCKKMKTAHDDAASIPMAMKSIDELKSDLVNVRARLEFIQRTESDLLTAMKSLC
jgi:hypothetical protein